MRFVIATAHYAGLGFALEAKRKLTGDLGDFAACAFDFAFVVGLETEIVKQTVGRLFPAYREMK